MNDSPNDTSRGKRPGGQPGNTNGQRHGMFSRIAPPTVQDLRALADVAIEEQDVDRLRRIERACKFHGYTQAEKMLRAARAMLDYDQRKEEKEENEATPDPMDGSAGCCPEGARDDWPEPEPFADDTPQRVTEWSTTYYPIAKQQALSGLTDPLPEQPSLFHGRRDARGTTAHETGAQDAFPRR